ncbi:C2H2 and C2HC zinc finger protein [Favolaschia claudopus]|uniref:C2H2 and C2HC zinc finger protein n=1 Tax=Favolaschia claudopus TaxID=2862362 RepID=A0AAV9Z9X3_9AGAR
MVDPQAFFDSLPSHIPRPVGILQPADARGKADPIRKELFASWNRLKSIVLAHEETIQKRWKKRTGIKRKQLLQEIAPTLPTEHAPEISALNDSEMHRSWKRNVFLFPYLNLEDLSINNGTQFLGLMHARAHYHPSAFAWFDSDVLSIGIVSGGITRYHGMDCTMVSFGDESTYGRVLEYNEQLDTTDQNSPTGSDLEFTLRESMSFGDGLVVLEAESKLMAFLLAAVSKILCDLDLNNPTPAPPLPPPIIPNINPSIQWQSSARLNALQPYGPPPGFSIDNIHAMIEAQYQLAIQHLADLRSEPIYFAETLQAYYDHRFDSIQGKTPPSLIQSRAVSLMLSDAYTFFAYYHVGRAAIEDFRPVSMQYPDGPPRACDLPADYEEALRRLHPILQCLEMHITKVHHQTLCSSSALREGLTIRSVDSNFAKHSISFARKPNDKLYSFLVLLLDQEQTHLWRLPRIFDQLDRLTQNPENHRRISPLIASFLTHWGVASDCKSIVERHRPAVEFNEKPEEGAQKRLQKWVPLLKDIMLGVGPDEQLAAKAFPVTKFVYPKGPKSSAWAEKCGRVDDAFIAFWTAADRILLNRCGKELFALGNELAPSTFERTDWAAVAAPKVVVRPKAGPDALAPFGGAAQSATGSEKPSFSAKTKVKTRGVAIAEEESATIPPPIEDADVHNRIPPIPVPAKTLKVFSTLFNAAKNEEVALQQSSVAWKDIQAAFVQVGFELIKTRGSAWTFRHLDGTKSVTVHEPHPEPTMRFWDARRFGRRLTRRFGWTLESFVLESAASA